jgi:hypothetical protein
MVHARWGRALEVSPLVDVVVPEVVEVVGVRMLLLAAVVVVVVEAVVVVVAAAAVAAAAVHDR